MPAVILTKAGLQGAKVPKGFPPTLLRASAGRQEPRSQGLKLLADGREPVDLVPVVPDPVQVQVAPRTVPAEVRNEAVAAPALPDGTKSDNRELVLNFGVLLAEGEKYVKLGRTASHPVKLAERLVG
ncbi:hypothetical protein COX10_02585 [Candidatus Berkelbacteria bacterium CG23_combo_of_CG06-09_8_20_14_all_33_15]|uniref:Uncharacterized protein n=1 Tax=Candidatus Berkelbacteria bacterium CG_4_10_14_0_2_um_filter_35_9_33_12 TaxID=1974499 RepID=A0A2M7W4A9_9BACT|nr:MAG: hypothetical protein COX10_02585 [Candidatus Berkelbacteria bacterium CG23_combo_of_CG06-09_8_20_14_all_33_15]PJA20564.1 MAG: hypothetical protein COX60_01300 [Candidatus Berkelbacteria bacterium CG_4_10_14_0_2_um_filter_35_9_33_12]